MSCSSPLRIHLYPGDYLVVTVRSSMGALMGGCSVLDLVIGPYSLRHPTLLCKDTEKYLTLHAQQLDN